MGVGDGAAREPVHVRCLAQRRGGARAGRRPAGRPDRLPGGGSPGAPGRQGGDRLADGLAVQGDRRQGRGRAILREGAGRRRAVGGHRTAGRHGGRVAVRGLRGPGRPGAGCAAPARQAGRGRGRAVAAGDGHPRARAPDPDAAAPAVQHVCAVSRWAVRRAAVRPWCLPADLPRDGGRRVAGVVRVQRRAVRRRRIGGDLRPVRSPDRRPVRPPARPGPAVEGIPGAADGARDPEPDPGLRDGRHDRQLGAHRRPDRRALARASCSRRRTCPPCARCGHARVRRRARRCPCSAGRGRRSSAWAASRSSPCSSGSSGPSATPSGPDRENAGVRALRRRPAGRARPWRRRSPRG